MPKLPKYKKCARCGKKKSASSFCKDRKAKHKLSSYCRECKREASLITKYGLSSKDWDKMFKKQSNQCAICGRNTPTKMGWVVDHDHKTGKVRGIICDYCNVGIGRLMDDPVIVGAALNYLSSGTL